ncbi:hypothetical protein D3C87_1564890 [compost metagenome]
MGSNLSVFNLLRHSGSEDESCCRSRSLVSITKLTLTIELLFHIPFFSESFKSLSSLLKLSNHSRIIGVILVSIRSRPRSCCSRTKLSSGNGIIDGSLFSDIFTNNGILCLLSLFLSIKL